jgi:ABC-type multidrug transport system fused ATPase/permease subunit
MFRMVEADAGSILVDGVDIASVSLVKLRQGMQVIPQEPVLFSGTIRSNMDPFDQVRYLFFCLSFSLCVNLTPLSLDFMDPCNQHTDENIWACLNTVHMADKVRSCQSSAPIQDSAAATSKLSVGGGGPAHDDWALRSTVIEGGLNFSAGERQLLCLARTLLIWPKLLLMVRSLWHCLSPILSQHRLSES